MARKALVVLSNTMIRHRDRNQADCHLYTQIGFSTLPGVCTFTQDFILLTWLAYGLSAPPGNLSPSRDSGTYRVFLKCTSVSTTDRKKIFVPSQLLFASPVVYGPS